MTPTTIAKWYGELEAAGLVRTYHAGERTYGYFTTWTKHHRVRAKESKYPDPANTCQHVPADANTCKQMPVYTDSDSYSDSETYSETETKEEKSAGRAALSSDQLEILGEKMQAIQQRFPRYWPRLSALFRACIRDRLPFDVFAHGLERLSKAKAVDDPCAYFVQVAKIEKMNWAEAQNIAKASEWKKGEMRSVGSLLAEAQARAGGKP